MPPLFEQSDSKVTVQSSTYGNPYVCHLHQTIPRLQAVHKSRDCYVMSNAKQTRVCGNRMCGQVFVAGPRYKASWCGPCKNWLALYGDIRNPNRS